MSLPSEIRWSFAGPSTVDSIETEGEKFSPSRMNDGVSSERTRSSGELLAPSGTTEIGTLAEARDAP